MTTQLVLYCFLISGGLLILTSLLVEWLGRVLKVTSFIPEELREQMTPGWYLMNYIMDFIFYVAIPTFAFDFFYMLLPLTGIRIGVGVALLALVLGIIPSFMSLSLRIKLALPVIVHLMLSIFIKLAVSVIVIGYLFSL